jgi:hypothetical protein
MNAVHGTRPSAAREMDLRDAIWLAGLGAGARGPVRPDELARAVEGVAGHFWPQFSDLLDTCLDEMLLGGHLAAMVDRSDGSARLALTPVGHQTLSFLLSRPIPRPTSALGALGMRILLAFIDLAGPDERREAIASLIDGIERDRAARETSDADFMSAGTFARVWSHHEDERIERDLALLGRMLAATEE